MHAAAGSPCPRHLRPRHGDCDAHEQRRLSPPAAPVEQRRGRQGQHQQHRLPALSRHAQPLRGAEEPLLALCQIRGRTLRRLPHQVAHQAAAVQRPVQHYGLQKHRAQIIAPRIAFKRPPSRLQVVMQKRRRAQRESEHCRARQPPVARDPPELPREDQQHAQSKPAKHPEKQRLVPDAQSGEQRPRKQPPRLPFLPEAHHGIQPGGQAEMLDRHRPPIEHRRQQIAGVGRQQRRGRQRRLRAAEPSRRQEEQPDRDGAQQQHRHAQCPVAETPDPEHRRIHQRLQRAQVRHLHGRHASHPGQIHPEFRYLRAHHAVQEQQFIVLRTWIGQEQKSGGEKQPAEKQRPGFGQALAQRHQPPIAYIGRGGGTKPAC